jgi:hypothetical protein
MELYQWLRIATGAKVGDNGEGHPASAASARFCCGVRPHTAGTGGRNADPVKSGVVVGWTAQDRATGWGQGYGHGNLSSAGCEKLEDSVPLVKCFSDANGYLSSVKPKPVPDQVCRFLQYERWGM